MRVGIIGLGLMGSSLARKLASLGFSIVVYNRTISKAYRLSEELGCIVAGSPKTLADLCDVSIIFVSGDEALYDIAIGDGGIVYSENRDHIVINASTTTPMASSRLDQILRGRGLRYLEAPVYGSVSEIMKGRVLSFAAGPRNILDEVMDLLKSYSADVMYVGDVPKAMVLKLALNNIGLAAPCILAESLSLLEAWNVDIKYFIEASRKLWFRPIIERYISRIMEERPPRFKTYMAGKDYMYIARSLKEKRLPAHLAETLSAMYMEASINGYMDKDYPQAARYYIELARRARHYKPS